MSTSKSRCVTCSGPLYYNICAFCASRRRVAKPKVAGSGQIAGLTWRHQIARDTLKRLERERAKQIMKMGKLRL